MAAADELAQGSWRRRTVSGPGRSGDRRRCPKPGAGSCGCCSGWSGCCWPASAGTYPAVAEDAGRLPTMADAADARGRPQEDLRALALISLGSTEYWTARREEAGAAPGTRRRAGPPDRAALSGVHRPGLPGGGRALPLVTCGRPTMAGRRLSWPSGTAGPTTRPSASPAWCSEPCWRGRDGRTRPSSGSSAPNAPSRPRPSQRQFLAIRYVRGVLEQARGRDAEALTAFEAVDRWPGGSTHRISLIPRTRAQLVHSLVRLGQTERAAQFLAGLSSQDREHGEIRIAAADAAARAK